MYIQHTVTYDSLCVNDLYLHNLHNVHHTTKKDTHMFVLSYVSINDSFKYTYDTMTYLRYERALHIISANRIAINKIHEFIRQSTQLMYKTHTAL